MSEGETLRHNDRLDSPRASVTEEQPCALRRTCGRVAEGAPVAPSANRRVEGRIGYFASAPGTTRTCDARFRKPTLYPLSYGGSGCKLAGQMGFLLR